MTRIFLALCVISNIALMTAFGVGYSIGDASLPDPAIQRSVGNHMLFGLGTLVFACMLHAICLTYFMGTGRWIEETSNAYSLDQALHERNQRLKYRMLPLMISSILLVVAVGAFGAVADPGTPINLDGTLGLTGAQWHLTMAVVALLVNATANFTQYMAIRANSGIIDQVLAEVRRIRHERGLSIDD